MAKNILAPMSGNVTKINFGSGEKVKEKDIVFIMDAMKMEIEVSSPSEGTIGNMAQRSQQSKLYIGKVFILLFSLKYNFVVNDSICL